MPLVWKGPVKSASSSRSPASDHLTGESSGIVEFKFVQGQPRKKRKSKTPSTNGISRHQRVFSVSTSPVVGIDQQRPEIGPVLFDDELGQGSILHDHIESEGTLGAEDEDGSVPPAAVTTSYDALESSWISLQHRLDFQPDLGWCESELVCTTSNSPVVFGDGREDGKYNSIEYVLPPSILYQDLTQKYYNVLEMCKYLCYS